MPDNVYSQSTSGVQDVTVTIVSGQSVSSGVDLHGRALKRILVPAGVQGSTLRFYQATSIGGTRYLMQDTAGNVIAPPFTAGRGMEINPALFAGTLAVWVETCSDSAGATPQAQSADRAIELVGVGL